MYENEEMYDLHESIPHLLKILHRFLSTTVVSAHAHAQITCGRNRESAIVTIVSR